MWLFEMVLSFAEIWIFIMYLQQLFDYDMFSKNKINKSIIVSILYSVLITFCNRYDTVSNFNTIIAIILMLLTAKIVFNFNIKTCFLFASTYMLMVIITEMFYICVVGVILNDVDFVLKIISMQNSARVVAAVITKSTEFIICFILYKKSIKFSVPNTQANIYLLTVIISFFMVMKMMNVIMQNDIASLKIGISVLFIVFMAIICVVIYLNEKLFAEKMDIEKQKNVIAENKLLEEGIKNMNELYEKNSKNFHEFKHHLDVLNSFAKKGDCDKINEYLASFKLDDNIGKRFNTGNEIIDMVLNAKTKVIAKENINFSIDVSLNENFAISNNDLCSLLSNLIDNSIEACVKCSVRKIKLYIINKGNFTVITITNTSIENPTLSRFATSKMGNHGWGMSIINDIVKKYDGISEHTYEDNIFKTKIILFTEITD